MVYYAALLWQLIIDTWPMPKYSYLKYVYMETYIDTKKGVTKAFR